MAILVADADPFNLRLLSELCRPLGYDVITAADGDAVLDAVARQQPQLLLMDAALPGTDGYQVLRILKGDADLSNIPVLLVTSEDDVNGRKLGLELGADDYVTKPYKTFEIQQRPRNLMKLQAAQDAAAGHRPVEEFSIADPLTGAGTASQLHISLDYEYTRAVRYRHPLSCVVVRCENLDDIMRADETDTTSSVLVPLAAVLRGCIRGVDHVFRSAPEEFTIVLPETDDDGCRIVVERLNDKTADGAIFAASVAPPPRIAVGSASYPALAVQDGEALWRDASASLRPGRDTIPTPPPAS